FIDFLPASLLFGFGLSFMVAPLTTALMTSVPPHNSGIASAINNAISRVGSPLAGALIFVAVTASFYAGLQQRLPSLDLNDEQVRLSISPLNVQRGKTDPQLIAAERDASTDAFHLAMLIGAGLFAAGAIVNAAGIRDPERQV